MDHPIEQLMKTTMDSIKQMIDVNTIVGDAVETKEGSVIIPISKVSVGFASGGSDFNKTNKTNSAPENNTAKSFPFGGGSGAGVSVQPVAFLVVAKDQVRLLPVNQCNPIDRIVDTVPNVIDQVMNYVSSGKKQTQSTTPFNDIQNTTQSNFQNPNPVSFDNTTPMTTNNPS